MPDFNILGVVPSILTLLCVAQLDVCIQPLLEPRDGGQGDKGRQLLQELPLKLLYNSSNQKISQFHTRQPLKEQEYYW